MMMMSSKNVGETKIWADLMNACDGPVKVKQNQYYIDEMTNFLDITCLY